MWHVNNLVCFRCYSLNWNGSTGLCELNGGTTHLFPGDVILSNSTEHYSRNYKCTAHENNHPR